MMSSLVLLLALSAAPVGAPLPPEVQAFVVDRDRCDHFRGEPTEGASREQVERRRFVQQSLEIHCAGTDRRLAALRLRYASNAKVMAMLNAYEPAIEGPRCEEP